MDPTLYEPTGSGDDTHFKRPDRFFDQIYQNNIELKRSGLIYAKDDLEVKVYELEIARPAVTPVFHGSEAKLLSLYQLVKNDEWIAFSEVEQFSFNDKIYAQMGCAMTTTVTDATKPTEWNKGYQTLLQDVIMDDIKGTPIYRVDPVFAIEKIIQKKEHIIVNDVDTNSITYLLPNK